MIIEAVLGLFVSLIGIFIFVSIKYTKSVSEWVLETSRFVYFSGHPLFDDNEKQQLIAHNFKNVFITLVIVILKTITIIFLILFIVALFSVLRLYLIENALVNFESSKFFKELFPPYLYKAPFIIGSLLPILFIPKILKNSKSKKVAYSPIGKFLHYSFLGNTVLAKMLFRIEKSLNKRTLKSNHNVKSVYVSGLARAGTTVLMQYLGQLSEFESLSYRNLPFLLLPKTWPKISSKKKIKEAERYHQDGIKHSLNSYEALEEPFWLHYLGHDYVKEKSLEYHTISSEVFEKYNLFRKLVADEKIYLSKNNNHLLRALSLHSIDQKKGNSIKTIIPFREPHEQAKSLLNQHANLSRLQNEDEFTLDYMDFLVHHEFGKNNKVSFLDNQNTHPIFDLDENSIEYWLEVWYVYYKRVHEIYKDKSFFYFFSYEHFVAEPYRSLVSLARAIELPVSLIDTMEIKKFEPKNIVRSPISESKYSELYNKLILNAVNYEN